MKGNNELILNYATVMESLQEYLDKRMGVFSPRVASIRPSGDTIIVSVCSDSEGLSAAKEEP